MEFYVCKINLVVNLFSKDKDTIIHQLIPSAMLEGSVMTLRDRKGRETSEAVAMDDVEEVTDGVLMGLFRMLNDSEVDVRTKLGIKDVLSVSDEIKNEHHFMYCIRNEVLYIEKKGKGKCESILKNIADYLIHQNANIGMLDIRPCPDTVIFEEKLKKGQKIKKVTVDFHAPNPRDDDFYSEIRRLSGELPELASGKIEIKAQNEWTPEEILSDNSLIAKAMNSAEYTYSEISVKDSSNKKIASTKDVHLVKTLDELIASYEETTRLLIFKKIKEVMP